MPFFLIPSALGVCFFLIWAFIGGMIFRDCQIAAQQEVDSDLAILPLSIHRAPTMRHRPKIKRASRKRAARFAS
jgi:hypothetical protein